MLAGRLTTPPLYGLPDYILADMVDDIDACRLHPGMGSQSHMRSMDVNSREHCKTRQQLEGP